MDIDTLRVIRSALRKLELGITCCMKDGSECCGITLAQCNTIFEIAKCDVASVVDLASELGLDTSTLSRVVNGLVEKGFVNRILNPTDRRYVSISLTEQGKELYNQIDKAYNDYLVSIFNKIPAGKQRQVMEAIVILSDTVQKIRRETECCGEGPKPKEGEDDNG